MCDYGRLVSVDKRPKDEKRGIEAHALPPPYYGTVWGKGGRVVRIAVLLMKTEQDFCDLW